MSAEQFVQASYRGLEVGERLKLCDFGPNTAHLQLDQPLPHGTPLELKTEAGVQIPVIVVRVHEQVSESTVVPGMRVHAEGLSGDAKDWWSALVSTSDPTIPELAMVAQAPEPTAEPTPEPTAESEVEAAESVPEAIEAQVTKPFESQTSTKRTQIMNVAQIKAAIADKDDEAAPAAAGDGNNTVQMSQADLQAVLDKERAAAGDDKGKKKKKRRKKKR